MSDLLAARLQMALSLAFHIVFACIGMAMPFFMAVAHWKWLKTRNPVFRDLTQAWAKGVAIFFATGAVSGTVLSFELGLLWPEFMRHAGPLIGMPFSWEGTAFFIEAIALGLFLYGWDKLPPKLHWISGVVVGISGLFSAVFVLCANGWMNTPTGFDWVDGKAINIDPVRAMFNPSAYYQWFHMTLAAFEATGFAVAGIHAALYLKGRKREFHQQAFQIAILFAAASAILQPLSGDFSAKHVARAQPAKLAAMENLKETTSHAPLKLLGVEIPGLLSFLAHGSFEATVTGLNEFAPEDRPPGKIVHLAFQIMILIGTLLAVFGGICFWKAYRKQLFDPRLLKFAVWMTPLGFVAMEAGWVVTEVGRQPWIIYQIMRTKDALTPVRGIVLPFLLFALIYIALSIIVFWLMKRQVRALHQEET